MKPLLAPWWFALLCLGAACTQPTTQMATGVPPSTATSPPAAPTPPAAPAPTTAPVTTMPTHPAERAIATFANGCFWCTEAVLEQLDGVLDVTSGYMGGTIDAPTYEQVCRGSTGHAECVQVTFDPARIRYEDLLAWFFRSHGSDHPEPPGRRRRHPVSLGHLRPRRRAAAGGAAGDRDVPATVRRPDRHRGDPHEPLLAGRGLPARITSGGTRSRAIAAW